MLQLSSTRISYWKKASLTACLLFCLRLAHAQPDAHAQAREQLYNLNFEKARSLAPGHEIAAVYLRNLANAWELLVNDDPALRESFEKQKNEVDGLKSSGPQALYAQADLALYWSLIHLKFGREVESFWQLRKAYQLSVECLDEYPDFVPIRKTLGILQIALDAVPDSYHWMISLMGMESNFETGWKNLQTASHDPMVGYEAIVLMALVQGYLLQQPAIGAQLLLSGEGKKTLLTRLVGASLYLKNSEAEKALTLLNGLDTPATPAFDYLTGEALLCRGSYPEAAAHFENYIRAFKGANLIRDAWFKLGLCHQLSGNVTEANRCYATAKTTGIAVTEADKHATRALENSTELNSSLYKIRFHIDGGYYEEARKEIRAITPADIPSRRDQTEFYYRQARLAHKTNQPSAALLFYGQVIDMSKNDYWYFAPNACLQSGYIYRDAGDNETAEAYFRKTLTYQKYEYKNSLDTKARSALAQLRDDK